MCIYCMLSDHMWKFDPPWEKPKQPSPDFPWHPSIPQPFPSVTKPIIPWDIERLKEFRDLLKEIHELEEKLGCPCEPKEANYIDLLEKRIKVLKDAKL